MSLKHLILAVVGTRPATGYEITKEFDEVAGFYWRATHQQVYRELAALAEAGLVRFKEVEQQGKPDKKVYTITAKGRRAFADWFREPPEAPRHADPLMIKFFAAELVGIEDLRAQLALARERHAALLATFEAIEAKYYAEPVDEMPRWKKLIYLTLRLGITRERAWLRWAEESERVLRACE
ncbi:PadR family transcriptional regulator [Polyangium sp. 15x6]|uniref:PadR family transcriptional regulator n=1 Tax=Polyangium sp. 15x6 TaxID=3042687 RepID=UPI00249ACDB2|nr:PadR family transcriptional regulator [Polyangium sp. 15x6]MDI3290313.1 PadR family transcriptional regulator [Polyangium sp. 15x6]